MILPVVIYGDSVLRKHCVEIAEITPELKKLAADMIETMQYEFRGGGLAAPQIGKAIRMFVTCMVEFDENEKPYYLEPRVYINPELKSYSEDTITLPEGCLSIPGFHVEVERPDAIVIEYTDLDGKRNTLSLEGWEARTVLHENDHLNGVLQIDRTSKYERKRIDPLLKVLKQRK